MALQLRLIEGADRSTSFCSCFQTALTGLVDRVAAPFFRNTFTLRGITQFVREVEVLERGDDVAGVESRIISFSKAVFPSQPDLRLSPEERQTFADWMEKRLFDPLTSRHLSIETKAEIIQNALRRFNNFLPVVRMRVNRDVAAAVLATFGIPVGSRITQVFPLGVETHVTGEHAQIPLRIFFENGGSIVYKPRSMIVEHLLFDRDVGIMSHAEGFGTYRIIPERMDGGEIYSYSEFLVPEEAGNTFSSPEQVEEYVRKLRILDLLAQRFGISDLHAQNIVTVNLSPHIVDAEVYSLDRSVDTLIFSRSGPLYRLTDTEGRSEPSRVWGLPRERELSAVITRAQEVRNLPEWMNGETLAAIEERLRHAKARALPVATGGLQGLATRTDHLHPSDLLEESIGAFMEDMGLYLNERFPDFFLEEEARAIVRRRLLIDASNLDLAILHCDYAEGQILMDGIIIARRRVRA